MKLAHIKILIFVIALIGCAMGTKKGRKVANYWWGSSFYNSIKVVSPEGRKIYEKMVREDKKMMSSGPQKDYKFYDVLPELQKQLALIKPMLGTRDIACIDNLLKAQSAQGASFSNLGVSFLQNNFTFEYVKGRKPNELKLVRIESYPEKNYENTMPEAMYEDIITHGMPSAIHDYSSVACQPSQMRDKVGNLYRERRVIFEQFVQGRRDERDFQEQVDAFQNQIGAGE